MAEKNSGLLHDIWELTTKLSEEALNAAAEKAQELKLEMDKGVVSFAETRINLIYSRDLIADAIQHEKLIQLPLTIQKDLDSQLSEIIQSLAALANGVDEIVALTDRVEKLNTLLWQYGFHNLSDEVLGYEKKINQLKAQEVTADGLMTKLRDVEGIRDSAQISIKQLDDWKNRAELSTAEIDQLQKKAMGLAEITSNEQLKVAAAYASVKQNNEDASRLLSAITTSSGQATTLKEQIAEAFSAIDPRRIELAASIQALEQANLANQNAAEALLKKIAEDAASAQSDQQKANAALDKKLTDAAEAINTEVKSTLDTFSKGAASGLKDILDDNEKELAAMKARYSENENQIKVQIERAIGVSLFGAFQKRQDAILLSKRFWQNALFGSVVAGILLGGYFAYEIGRVQKFDYAFLVKLTLSLPVIYAISFCSIQYGKERRLEEEYAFKASISVSLTPYQELVGKLVDLKVPDERAKYTEFIIGSITSIFASPTDKVYETPAVSNDPNLIEKAAKQLAPILDPIAKIISHK
jgi:hypothetical protein